METQSDKDKVIRTIYYDSDSGFGSIAQTYKDAKNVLNTITYENVKEFMEKQRIQQLKGYKGFNSYVAKEPLQEIQIDLAVFTDSAPDNNGYKYAFVAVDIFTKFCHAVPIKDKQPNESLRAMKEVLNVIGKPKTLYHDFEGSWNSKQFITLLNENGVRQIITSSPPPFAERMIQTIKNMIHTRLEGLEMEKEKWINLLPAILKKYNNTEHSTTGVKPSTKQILSKQTTKLTNDHPYTIPAHPLLNMLIYTWFSFRLTHTQYYYTTTTNKYHLQYILTYLTLNIIQIIRASLYTPKGKICIRPYPSDYVCEGLDSRDGGFTLHDHR